MTQFLKGVALFALIACGVWIAVLWHWQATVRDISTSDIVMYLGVLPVTLFVFVLLLRSAWAGVADKLARGPEAGADTKTGHGASTAAVPDVDEQARHATLQLIAAHLVCAAGSSASELEAAALDGAPRPALDAALRDDDGLPLMAARIADLDVSQIESRLEPLIASMRLHRPEWAALSPPDHVVRALAALEGPLSAAVESLRPWSARFVPGPAVSSAMAEADRAPELRVRVLIGWPAHWSGFDQELGRACALDWLAASGAGWLPAARFALTVYAVPGEDLLLQAHRLLQTLAREDRDDPVIVTACHSAIGATAIAALERAGTLFTASRPKAQMPGEAAAALVLARSNWPAAPGADSPLPHLHRPSLQRRDKSVDGGGRINGDVVAQTIEQALATGRIDANALAGLVCDADQHTPRTAEFYGASVALLPGLDSNEDMRLIATVTGAVGAVSPLLVLACATERATSTEKPQLAVTVGDAFVRMAVVVRPGPPPAPENAATKGAAA